VKRTDAAARLLAAEIALKFEDLRRRREIKGDPGEPGVIGPQGERGVPGFPGMDGVNGDQGPKGETGDRGLKGDPGERGLPGVDGRPGDRGERGPEGKRGVQGPTGAPGESPRWRGPWQQGTIYAKGDLVEFQGSTWVALVGGPGVRPGDDPRQWGLVAAKGADARGGRGPDLATTLPAALGVAAVGTSATAARSDHVHTAPAAVDLSPYLTSAIAAATYLPLAGGTLSGGLAGTTATFSGAVSSTVASGSAALAMATGQRINFNAAGTSFIHDTLIQFRTGVGGLSGAKILLGTAGDNHFTVDSLNCYSQLNPIVNQTLHLGYIRCATDLSNNTIRFGNGRNATGVLGTDTFSATSGYIPHLLHNAIVQPASGSLKFAGLELNSTLNGVSSAAATMLAIAPKVTAWTGGTVNLIDAGTTTTDYNTGFTSKFKVDTNGKITVPSAAGAPTAGTATLVGGTVTVNTTAITANSKVMLSRNTTGGTLGHLSAPQASRTAGTSFVINSSSGTETSTVDWHFIDAA
jgi:hypothetical protein